MDNKKGFTLVELLAVIAILAILVIIALPNIMSLFNEAKKNSFITEIKNLAKTAEQQWMSDSMFETNEIIYSRCDESCSNELKLTGRQEIKYYIKVNKAGKIVTYAATDGTYQYNYSGTGLNIEEIDNVDQIASITANDIITIKGDGPTSKTIICSSVTYQDGTICSKVCGGGTYNRLAYSTYDNSRCSSKDVSSGGSACNTQGCCSQTTQTYGSWSAWGPCTKTCGGGFQTRTRTVTYISFFDGSLCRTEPVPDTLPCNTQDCCSSVTYQDGTTCTKRCGGGTYNRLAYSAYDGTRCSSSDQSSGGSACNTQACCSSVTYVDGITCSKTCGGGTYNRLAYSAYDGSRCSSKDQSSGGAACNTHSCDISPY